MDRLAPGHRRARLGRRPGRTTFAPFAARGHRPARVVAVHRETSIVRDGRRRPAGDGVRGRSGSRRSPLRLPDRRRLGRARRRRRDRGRPAASERLQADGRRRHAARRRARRRADHGLQRRRRPARRRARQRLQPAPHRALPRRRLVERDHPGRRAQQVRPRRRRRRAPGRGRGDRPGRRHRRRSRPGPAPGSTELLGAPHDRARPPRSSARPASASPPWSTRSSARTARRPPRCAIATRAAATRRPIASCSSCPAGRCWSTRPGSGRSRCWAPTTGVETAFDDVIDARLRVSVQRLPPRAASRAAPSGRRSPTAGSSEDRLASHRKLEREMAHAARQGDPRARAEHRRTWRIISKSVNEHMAAQVRRRSMTTRGAGNPDRPAGRAADGRPAGSVRHATTPTSSRCRLSSASATPTTTSRGCRR